MPFGFILFLGLIGASASSNPYGVKSSHPFAPRSLQTQTKNPQKAQQERLKKQREKQESGSKKHKEKVIAVIPVE